MKKIYAFLIFATLISCTTDGTDFFDTDLALNNREIILTAEEQETRVLVFSNTTWSANKDNDATNWLTLNNAKGKGNGSFIVKVLSNKTLEERIAKLEISTSKKSKELYIKQAPEIIAQLTNNEITYNKQNLKIPIQTNVTWIAKINSDNVNWARIDKAQDGILKGEGNGNINLVIEENSSTNNRELMITVETENNIIELTIVQSGKL